MARGMRTLRQRVVDSALALSADTHKATTSANGFIPPLLACSRPLLAGCTVSLSMMKQWSPGSSHLQALLQCHETLTRFMPHWKGGPHYLQVWTAITSLIDQPQNGTSGA